MDRAYLNAEKKQFYISKMRPLFNKDGIFSDESRQFRSPFEPEAGDVVTLRIRTLKNNVDAVYYISGNDRVRMKKKFTANGFDYYEIEIKISEQTVSYYFGIACGSIYCYYNKLGVTKELNEEYAFTIIPNYKIPDWIKGAVMYQIFVDRFYNGDKSNDVLDNEYFYINKKVKSVSDWYQYSEAMDVANFYGGDLQGVIDKLDYLLDLGVQAIYLNPIFVSPSNHKYDIQDYDYVDPHFGRIVTDEGEVLKEEDKDNKHATRYIKRVTDKRNLEAGNQVLITLIEEAHKRGIRVILDGVFNHCGSFNKWMDREQIYKSEADYEDGAYISKDSPYHSYFRFTDQTQWPNNETYDGWWGHDTLPKLNYEGSGKLVDEIMRIAAKWVSPPYNADGWRLDVAADLGYSNEYNHTFWKMFRKSVKEANPDAVILAEHYGNARSWLGGDEWDTTMNYDAFMEPVSWFLTGMEKHSDEFREDMLGNAASFVGSMRYHSTVFSRPSLEAAMNELDNHDHSRFLTRTNRKVGRIATAGAKAAEEGCDQAVLRIAVVMQMTHPGAPTIYYGDEAGVFGFTDPDSRRTYPWGREDRDLIRFYKNIIYIRKKYPVLANGSMLYLKEDYNIIAYGRFNLKEIMIVVVNNRDSQEQTDIPVWRTGISRTTNVRMTEIFSTNAIRFSTVLHEHEVRAGYLTMTMLPKSAVILSFEQDLKTSV